MTARSYHSYIEDLLVHADVRRLKETQDHHWKRDRFSHCYAVGRLSFRLAKFFHANVTIAARAGFLHDWYHGHPPDRERFINADQHHFRISHKAAAGYGEHAAVLHAIRTHFWPWGRTMPRTREAWIVWMADNIIWFDDILYSLRVAVRDWRRGTNLHAL